MTPLAQRIKDAEQRLVSLRDNLTEHLKTVDDSNPTDEGLTISTELNGKIEMQEKQLDMLKASEQRLAATVDSLDQRGGGAQPMVISSARPFAMPAKKVQPIEYLWRGLTVSLKHHMEKHQRPVLDVLKDTYGEDECTRAVMAGLITRAASAPATTTTTGWAAELVQTTVGEFFSALQPMAVYPQLRARGGSFTFGRAGIVTLPSRLATPTIAGSFVGQGSPIPVRQGAFASVSLTPKKMAVISTFTREISEHSTPAIEALIRQAILEDTAVSIDSVLLDSTAASAIRPAGLRNGVSTLTPVAGGGITSLIGDLKAMVNALITSSSGNIRSPVWLMSPGDRLSMALTQAAAGGDLPFRDELTRGTLLGYPVIESTSITADTIYLIDAADFMTATGDDPRFDVSDQATLHMEDTTPLAIGTVGTPNTVASPVRSLWQTDTIGIRMLLDMNWAMRRTGMVQYTTGVLWN